MLLRFVHTENEIVNGKWKQWQQQKKSRPEGIFPESRTRGFIVPMWCISKEGIGKNHLALVEQVQAFQRVKGRRYGGKKKLT